MTVIETLRVEFVKYKALAEKAIEQLDESQLAVVPGGTGNSIATICWHLSGNLRSRFTDFLTSDGEKAWRKRDEEFEPRAVARTELLEKWESGWQALTGALESLTDADLQRTVTIRGEAHSVVQALVRALAHVSSHVGQIVYAAKMLRGEAWSYLSIAPGQSEAFNQEMGQKKL